MRDAPVDRAAPPAPGRAAAAEPAAGAENSPRPGEQAALESTASLLERARQGDESARNQLIQRGLPALQSWAHGRLPARAREVLDTDDLVQVTVLKALKHLGKFEPRHPGAFLAYLRQILLNEIRQELRRVARRPGRGGMPGEGAATEPSPLEQLVGKETLAAYDAALLQLPEQQRQAVILRLELGFRHAQIAEMLGSPSVNAARMTVYRGLLRLSEVMNHDSR